MYIPLEHLHMPFQPDPELRRLEIGGTELLDHLDKVQETYKAKAGKNISNDLRIL